MTLACTGSAHAEGLYLIAGAVSGTVSPATFEAELYRAEAGKPLRLVRKLASGRQGLSFLLADHEGGLIAVGRPYFNPSEIEFISMSDPEKQRIVPIDASGIPKAEWVSKPASLPERTVRGVKSSSVRQEYLNSLRLASAHFLQPPGEGRLLVLDLISAFGEEERVYRVSAAVPAAGSDSAVTRLRKLTSGWNGLWIRSAGLFGVPTLGARDAQIVQSRDGAWRMGSTEGLKALDMPTPTDLPMGAVMWTMAQNAKYTVINLTSRTAPDEAYQRAAAGGNLRIYRREDRAWETIPVAGPVTVRLLGEWVLALGADAARGRRNPGGNRRALPSPKIDPTRPPIESRLSAYYLPGTLHLYHAATRRSWTVQTGEADSEPLAVSGSTIYYRVNDRILAADFQGSSVGPPREIARGDPLRDVHWAFLGP